MVNQKKYIFITGGVTSSLGKGLAAASIASLLERRGISLNLLKMDPYINVDPGTMSPTQHGEVFVTDDGAETDLDLGHYERFTHLSLKKENNFTSGQVYLKVIENEREGKYLGKTVQVVPHITDEIKRRIHQSAKDVDLLISEIGGTVGDIESLPFLEAIRQFSLDVGMNHVCFIHLVLVPYLEAAGELKSKPAQHSVKELRSIGLNPHLIICRAHQQIDQDILNKISLFSNVSTSQVFQSIDLPSIYELPLNFHHQGLDDKIAELLGIWSPKPKLDDWELIKKNQSTFTSEVKIALVGKYTDLNESYKSLNEALLHAAMSQKVRLTIETIDSSLLESNQDILKDCDAILIPGGFGIRGTEGKIAAIRWARINKKPFLGICLGMQLAVIEFARNIADIQNAHSEEFTTDGELVIHYMKGQLKDSPKGGTMRLGAYDCTLMKSTLAHNIYQTDKISERHRHRLEVNNDYISKLESAGLILSGKNIENDLVEIIEIKDHPFFIACQFHPEFKSKPFKPHPIFISFIKASTDNQKKGKL